MTPPLHALGNADYVSRKALQNAVTLLDDVGDATGPHQAVQVGKAAAFALTGILAVLVFERIDVEVGESGL